MDGIEAEFNTEQKREKGQMRGISEGSPAVYVLPSGLQSLLTTTQSETVYSHDHYQRSQRHLLYEVQSKDRDHQRGAGHPEKRPAGRDGPMRRLRQKEISDGQRGSPEVEATRVIEAEWNPAEPNRSWESLLLVDTGAIKCVVPGQHLEAIGFMSEGRRTHPGRWQ